MINKLLIRISRFSSRCSTRTKMDGFNFRKWQSKLCSLLLYLSLFPVPVQTPRHRRGSIPHCLEGHECWISHGFTARKCRGSWRFSFFLPGVLSIRFRSTFNTFFLSHFKCPLIFIYFRQNSCRTFSLECEKVIVFFPFPPFLLEFVSVSVSLMPALIGGIFRSYRSLHTTTVQLFYSSGMFISIFSRIRVFIYLKGSSFPIRFVFLFLYSGLSLTLPIIPSIYFPTDQLIFVRIFFFSHPLSLFILCLLVNLSPSVRICQLLIVSDSLLFASRPTVHFNLNKVWALAESSCEFLSCLGKKLHSEKPQELGGLGRTKPHQTKFNW